jgi:hypothetical protein
MKQIEGARNVKKNQDKNLEVDVNQDIIENVSKLKKEEE